ncbi:MAG: Ferritin, Dps family protein [Deltaproteobacteria bacterium]|nr:Ferritin, Dps family protein [Deltaproteobacteria bacterium]
MLETDKKDEEAAITMYKKIIEVARNQGDETTEFLFNRILSDEEEHHDLFTSLLEKD